MKLIEIDPPRGSPYLLPTEEPALNDKRQIVTERKIGTNSFSSTPYIIGSGSFSKTKSSSAKKNALQNKRSAIEFLKYCKTDQKAYIKYIETPYDRVKIYQSKSMYSKINKSKQEDSSNANEKTDRTPVKKDNSSKAEDRGENSR